MFSNGDESEAAAGFLYGSDAVAAPVPREAEPNSAPKPYKYRAAASLLAETRFQIPPLSINMSGKAGGKGGRGKGAKGKSVSRSTKAGLQFPVGRIARFLRKGRFAARVGGGSPVYLAAVLEYLTAEVLVRLRSTSIGRVFRLVLSCCFARPLGFSWFASL